MRGSAGARRGRPGSGAAGMFTPWSPTGDDASRWSAGVLVGARRASASAPTSWSTRCGDDEQASRRRRRSIVVHEQQPPATQDLGFPAFATKNTTRVAGADPVADAAGVALAVFPSTGGVEGPAAVTPGRRRRLGRRGSPRRASTAPPVGAPILITGTDDDPRPHRATRCARLPRRAPRRPTASRSSRSASATAPRGLETRRVTGDDPAEIAAAIDRLRQKLTGDQPRAHPARELRRSRRSRCRPPPGRRARATRCCSSAKDSAPKPTLDALRRHKGVPVYVLGPRVGDLRQGARRRSRRSPRARSGSAPRIPVRERDRLRALRRAAASAGTSTTPGTGS